MTSVETAGDRALRRLAAFSLAAFAAAFVVYVGWRLLTAGLIEEIEPSPRYSEPTRPVERAWEEAWWRGIKRDLQPVCDGFRAGDNGRFRFSLWIDPRGYIFRFELAEATDFPTARRMVIALAQTRLRRLTPFSAAERGERRPVPLLATLYVRDGFCVLQRS